MSRFVPDRLVASVTLAALLGALATGAVSATHGGTHVTLESGTTGCNGVLPSNDGNTDMRFVGGSMQPGSTALYEITYPVDAAGVGKQFTITDCAFIDDVAALKYTVTFVPSNQAYVLTMALAIPANAPVGALYCNYAKTTGSPTASQGSQRKAGPACFTIQAPPAPAAPASAPPAAGAPPAAAGPQTPAGSSPAPGVPRFLPNTATAP
jgi:hypothetical protein